MTMTFTLLNPIHETTQNRAPPPTGRCPPPGGACFSERGQIRVRPSLAQVTAYIFSKTFSDSHADGKLKLRVSWKWLNKLVGRARSVRPRVWLHAQSWLRRRELAPRGMNTTNATTHCGLTSMPSLVKLLSRTHNDNNLT